jgi:L-malate glycosyltransferase
MTSRNGSILMRVLFVIETLGVGGAEILLVNLCQFLVRLGIHVEVAYLFPPADLANQLESHHIPVHFLNCSKYHVFRTVRELALLARRRRIQVMHAHLFHAALAAALCKCFGGNCPAIVTFHNRGYDAYPPSTPLMRMRRFLDGVIMRIFVDRFLAVSLAAADSARRHLRLLSVDVVSNGIDLDLIEESYSFPGPEARKEFSLPPDAKLVALPGRMVWEKGHRLFLEAWPKVVAACPDALGVFVGDGPLRGELEELAAGMDPGCRVRLMPRMEQRALYRFLRSCDLVAFPSFSEGWPLLVAEVMALGIPMVCTPAGGIPEALGDPSHAVVFPIGDAEGLAQGLIGLLQDQKRRQALSEAARRHAVANLSITSVAEKHLAIYREVLQRACASGRPVSIAVNKQ